VLVELANGYHPYAGKTEFEMQESFNNNEIPEVHEEYSDAFRNFIQRCLAINPKMRPSCV
jgi:serine/threonine protein kinase